MADDQRYTKLSWAGYLVFKCNFPKCSYDTFYIQQFDEHYYNRHEKPAQPVQRRLGAVLYDPHNRLITDIDDKEKK